MFFRRVVSFALLTAASLLAAQQSTMSGHMLDSQGQPFATSNKTNLFQLSGTVVDPSGAVINGATAQVRSADGTIQKTAQSDRNGYFILSGLAAGSYRLILSSPGFETKELPVNIGATGTQTPLRISLAVSAVNTTIKKDFRLNFIRINIITDLKRSQFPSAN